jgi:hypothetical protein
MSNHSYTYIPEAKVIVCDDCGAYARANGEVKHYATCKPGECAEWAKSYEEASRLERPTLSDCPTTYPRSTPFTIQQSFGRPQKTYSVPVNR